MKKINRPENWEEYIGQEKIINNLKVFTKSSIKQNKSLDHIFIYGPSGYGKTSLAYLLSKVLKSKLRLINGINLQKQADLISILTCIKEKEILFIDEIHSVSKDIFEILYTVLEENKLNIIIGKDYNSKIINIDLPNFTIIAATTKIDKISTPLLDRFSINLTMDNYTLSDLSKIINLNAKKMDLNFSEEILLYIAKNSRYTPRIAINLLKRINDYLIINDNNIIDTNVIKDIFQKLEIYELGLTRLEIDYLNIINKYEKIGLESLAHLLNTNINIISYNIEPFLLREELINRTFKGRIITKKGKEYLSILKK